MESVNTLHVLHILYSFDTGGMEKGIATVINNGSLCFRHSVLCLKKSGASAHLLNKEIQIIELNKKEGNSLFFLFRLAKKIRQLKPDVVHTRNWGGLDGVIAAKLAGVKVIVHGEHGWSMDDPFGLNPKRVFLRRIADRFIDAYTCVSLQMKTWLEKDIRVRKNVLQIYNGLDFYRFFPGGNGRLRSELKIPLDFFVIGIVARMDPIKNHPILIQVFNKIHQKHPASSLVIIGDGPERKRLEQMGMENIFFMGNRTDVHELLKDMDLFVLPSFNEGISNTIMEAMASGLPVIASKRGGNPELIKNNWNGYLFEPEDSIALEKYMLKYIQEPEVRKVHGSRSRQTAWEKFSIEKMVSNYETVWKNVSKTGRPAK